MNDTMKIDELLEMPILPLADEYPLLHGEEFIDLAKSIDMNGIREPLFIWEGFLLDGRNRLRAADKAGVIEVPVRIFKGTIEEAEDLVIDLNEKRRHLTAGQRAYIADRHRDIVEARAAKRQTASRPQEGQQGFQSVPQDFAAHETGDTRNILADKHNVNHKYVDDMKKLRRVSEETMVDQERGGDARVATPRAVHAQQVLGQVKDGKVSMNAAVTSVFGNPGQEISSDADPFELGMRQTNDLYNKFHEAVIYAQKAEPSEARNKARENYRIKYRRLRTLYQDAPFLIEEEEDEE